MTLVRRRTVLLLLAIAWWLLESFDHERRRRGDHIDLGVTVLHGQLHGDSHAFPVTRGFGNVITDLLG